MMRPVLAHPETQKMKMTRAMRTMEPKDDTRPMTTPVKADEGEEDNPMMGFRRRERERERETSLLSRLNARKDEEFRWFASSRVVVFVGTIGRSVGRSDTGENNQVTTLGGRRHRRE